MFPWEALAPLPLLWLQRADYLLHKLYPRPFDHGTIAPWPEYSVTRVANEIQFWHFCCGPESKPCPLGTKWQELPGRLPEPSYGAWGWERCSPSPAATAGWSG